MARLAFIVTTLVYAMVFSDLSAADYPVQSEAPQVTNLAWMTGSWDGDIGGRILEENWTEAKAGSIAAVIRITTQHHTELVEIVNIQEMEGTLVLHIQQWGPGFIPISPAQKMMLDNLGERGVSFVATSPGGLKRLAYSLNDDNEFLIEATTINDQPLRFTLNSVSH